jgi:hypothetical protein
MRENLGFGFGVPFPNKATRFSMGCYKMDIYTSNEKSPA